MPEYLHVEDVPDADQNEYQHFAADSLEADLARELLIGNGTQNACDVVADHEDDKRDDKSVAAAEKVTDPSSDGGKDELYDRPEFLHV